MYIKDVILEGFKSYGRRTEIFGFDAEFTAITGLNGTGKSNILDGICFVMGITNLGQVRASSLQDLVFKNGQAGVTKATVTLVFDNTDENQCPLGYEKCSDISVTRQVIVGGKNKYLINGKNVTNKKVIDLFCSIKLNVNNPNFLIMQGRITKVLNMKPIEILSMVEEAAGTSTYETKRIDANKTIERKDFKLNELNSLLKEEIEPKLERLRKEHTQYLEYQKIKRDIENYTRISISHQYIEAKKYVENCENTIQTLTLTIENSKIQIVANSDICNKIDEECNELQEIVDGESGGQLQRLEETLAEKTKIETVAISSKKVIISELDTEKRNLKTLEKTIQEDRKLLSVKEQEMTSTKDIFENLKDSNDKDAKVYEDARKKFEALSSGSSINEDGESESLQHQLTSAKQLFSESNTNLKRYDMEFKHTTKLLNERQGELQCNDTAYLADKKKISYTENEINMLTKKLSTLNYEDGTLEKLENRKAEFLTEMRDIKLNLDRRNAHLYEFQYTDPEANFDRRRVKGMICKLFDVINQQHAMALSIVGGGHLYSVVTDTDVTSKKILQRGQLQRRVTIIPMNQIQATAITPHTVKIAQNLVGKDNVFAAMSVIQFDKQYEQVLQFIYGRLFICSNLDIAKQVAFHPNIQCKCVTLDGDIVDPEGTLTGGAAPKNGAVLLDIAVIKRFELNFYEKENELNSINQQINQIQKIAHIYNQIKEQLNTYQIDLNGIRARFAQTSFQQQQQEITDLQTKLNTLKSDINNAKENKLTSDRKIKDIEAKLKDKKGYIERELSNALNEMKNFKQTSEKSKQKWIKKEQEYETLKLEIQKWKESIETGTKQLLESKSKIEEIELKLQTIINESKESTTIVNQLKLEIKQIKDKINNQNKEIQLKCKKRVELQQQNNDLKITIKKTEHNVTKLQNENKEAFNLIDLLEDKYKWIQEDKEFFGLKNTRYDYSKEDPVEAGKKLDIAEKKKNEMERTINVKAMVLLQTEEQQYTQVIKRREIVLSDKCKIQAIIQELDKKRKVEIRNAWKAIDLNFSKIFTALLPGADAKLTPPEGKDFLVGLQIKVGFNGMWKESLNELSGGQRSLVALSLILAMLKYKPSPVYILDEVDAALDMSHTQNIGNMLKTYFNKSQFIIVSLKDGMFTNANVLFKTKFEDGVSVVARSLNPNK